MSKHGWTYKKLGEVGKVITGSTPSTKDPASYSSNDYCLVKPSDLRQIGITKITDSEFHISTKAFIESRRLPKGSVLTTCIGIIGKVGVLEVDATCNQQINAIIPSEQICSPFLAYSILSQRKIIEAKANAPVVPIINKSNFSKISIPVPPMAEQEAIVAELDEINEAIAALQQQVADLDTLAQSTFYDMFGDPVTNPKAWEIKTIEQLFDVGSSKRVFEAQWRTSGVPFYRAREIVRLSQKEPIQNMIFIEQSLYDEYSKKYGAPHKGDMMVTGVGTLGICYLVDDDAPFYFKDGNILWFKSLGLCDTKFIRDQFYTDFVKRQIQYNANAAVVGTYTITNAKKTKVIFPPLELQTQYVKKVEAIESAKAEMNSQIAEMQTLLASRMDYYFD